MIKTNWSIGWQKHVNMKIATIWHEMGIESIGELLYACNENRLLLYKGFGEKTQKNVADAIEFFMRNQGHFLYADVESYVTRMGEIIAILKNVGHKSMN